MSHEPPRPLLESERTLEPLEADVIVGAGAHETASATRETLDEFDLFAARDKTWPFKIRTAAFLAMKTGIFVVAGAFCSVLMVSLYHLIVPKSARWLAPEELHTLNDILALATTGAIGAFLGKYFKKIFHEVDHRD